ncbi:hypothetical protein GQ600_9929 [Phytophthora cactorum]|nr:hypothetical protein GQ600_14538 [Phytophthora cactorum]KAF1789108.1 hypothetical protein GQ600_9929 [Phytophthora cactorum]
MHDPCPLAVSRYDRTRLQRAREAVELFKMLAIVDRITFLEFLWHFVIIVDNIEDLFRDELKFVQPIWELRVIGKVSKHDPVAWGQLLGCQYNPMDYSKDFQSAMKKLEATRCH